MPHLTITELEYALAKAETSDHWNLKDDKGDAYVYVETGRYKPYAEATIGAAKRRGYRVVKRCRGVYYVYPKTQPSAARKSRAAEEIIAAAAANPAITVAGLRDEMERGAIDGWIQVMTRHHLNFSEWTGAMQLAINALDCGAPQTPGSAPTPAPAAEPFALPCYAEWERDVIRAMGDNLTTSDAQGMIEALNITGHVKLRDEWMAGTSAAEVARRILD